MHYLSNDSKLVIVEKLVPVLFSYYSGDKEILV